MYVLRVITVVTMGYSIDPLDVCFGDQLAGFVTLGNLCIGVGTRSGLSGSSFGALFEVLLCWLDEFEIV